MKEKLGKLLEDRRFYMVISLILAVMYWMVLSLADDSDIEKTFYNVPVQLDYNSSVYKGFGLDIIGDEEITVDVTVMGPRNLLNELRPDDFLIYPNVNSVTTGGIKELRLVYSTVNTTAPYSITHLSQDTVRLRFDRIVTQSFPVQIDSSNVRVADGYLLDTISVSPAEVSVTGPSEDVAKIVKVVASLSAMESAGDIWETKLTRGIVQLLDADGAPVDRTELALDAESVGVTIPVLQRTELALKVNFMNVPQGFNVESLGCKLDHETINVAVPSNFNGDLEYVVGHIDLGADNFDINQLQSFALQLPSGYTNLDNVSIVTASFDTQDYVTKMVTVSDVRVINAPEGKQITALTENIYNVELIGPAESIAMLDALEDEDMLSEYIIAQIDASSVSINRGQTTIDVDIILPSMGDVLAVGDYAVVINVG